MTVPVIRDGHGFCERTKFFENEPFFREKLCESEKTKDGYMDHSEYWRNDCFFQEGVNKKRMILMNNRTVTKRTKYM